MFYISKCSRHRFCIVFYSRSCFFVRAWPLERPVLHCKKQCFIQIHVPIFDVHLRRLAWLFLCHGPFPDLHHKSFFGDPPPGQGGAGQNYLSAPGYYKSASGRANHNVFSNAARGTKLVTPIALEGPGPRGTVFFTAISRSHLLIPIRSDFQSPAGPRPYPSPPPRIIVFYISKRMLTLRNLSRLHIDEKKCCSVARK